MTLPTVVYTSESAQLIMALKRNVFGLGSPCTGVFLYQNGLNYRNGWVKCSIQLCSSSCVSFLGYRLFNTVARFCKQKMLIGYSMTEKINTESLDLYFKAHVIKCFMSESVILY